MAVPVPDNASSSQIPYVGGVSDADTPNEKAATSQYIPGKGLTVTFRDVAVEVHGEGEDYGPTVASVVRNLVPSFGQSKQSTRVRSGVNQTFNAGTEHFVAYSPGCLRPDPARGDG